jgi:AcrR family transcriptional regulator
MGQAVNTMGEHLSDQQEVAPAPVKAAPPTRQVIIEAATRTFSRLGLKKTTIVDIATAAGVTRGTVYSHFKDKGAIVEASAEYVSQRFYREMLKAMNQGTTLEEKLSEAGAFVLQARRWVEGSEVYFDEDELGLLMTKNAGTLLSECVDFFVPYIAAAKVTGEVRRDLDVNLAGEWFARILFSLFSLPSSTFELEDPTVARTFVASHIVRGFK